MHAQRYAGFATTGQARARATERRVTADSGASKGVKDADYSLIPTEPLRLLAEHYGRGSQKYEPVNGIDNWRNGYPWSLSYAALQRHLNAFWAGEDIDPDSGSPHLAAAAWHCFALMHWGESEEMRERYDDRQDPISP